MAKIYQADLAGVLVDKYGITRKQALQFVSNVVSVIQTGLQNDRQVKIKGLGSFKIIEVDPRESVDVNTGERLLIEGHSKLVFVPDATMKELVNRPFSQFETVVLNEGVEFDDMNTDGNQADKQEEQQDDADIEESALEDEEVEFDEEEPVADEDEEPVVEEEQPVVEEEELVVEEEQPVVEEEQPVVEDEEPVIEEEQPVFVEEQPVVEEEQPVAAGFMSEGQEEEEQPTRRSHKAWWPVAVALAFAVGLGAGYYFGERHASQQAAAEPTEQPTARQEAPAAKPVTDTVGKKDTVVSTEQPVAKQTAQTQQASGVPEWERYNEMDTRTKNGFYYIMGLDRVEKVRKGETMNRLAKRVFGAEEMACYIEVFNGIDASTQLEEGADIKIPKVEPKKVVRRRLQQQQQNN